MTYIFDTNIFIRSKNEMPMDIWPTFWGKMQELVTAGQICTSVKVKVEIDRGNDELISWMEMYAPKEFYVPLDKDIIQKYAELQTWANTNPIFTENAKQTFAEVADAYLVATAAAKNFTLVTYETSDPMCRRRVKIPDACNALSVNFCDLNTAFREIGIVI